MTRSESRDVTTDETRAEVKNSFSRVDERGFSSRRAEQWVSASRTDGGGGRQEASRRGRAAEYCSPNFRTRNPDTKFRS